MRVGDVAGKICKALVDIARHVSGCHSTQDSRHEGSMYVWVTWRAKSEKVLVIGEVGARDGGRGLHSSTSLLNLSRFCH